MSIEKFKEVIEAGYTVSGKYITLGGAMYEGKAIANLFVNIPLKNLNRHGLIAGATGTGKTKTLQALTENLSKEGVPTLLMDLKGDLSGIAAIGEEKSFIKERHAQMNLPYTPEAFPVELLTISKQDGVRMRATVSEFGSVLLSRILDLSDVQEGVLAVVFKYCDDHQYPLLDLKDLKKVLQYATEEGKSEFESEYGRVAASSTSAILRKIVELENQGAELFFGERSFETEDLLHTDEKGRGVVNIIRLTDIQDRPKMFSTFMLCLLAEIYNTFPEIGDQEKPKLVIFIDEAHLIFNQASKALLNQLENIVKLIRSKGVGLIFCTQTPTDVPDAVLSQLGLKIQHALRAFTAKDRQAIKLTAQNYPETSFYNVPEYLTSLGTGEAFVTALDSKGRPTPLVATMMRAPMSRMDILTDTEIKALLDKSALKTKYNEVIDRESAYEILNAKIANEAPKEEAPKKTETKSTAAPKTSSAPKKSTAQNPIIKMLTSATFVRGVFGVLSKLMKK
ncbi:helicase HerA-like domain-containing protein [Capnocytophaga gingivalis]|uniref:helicase HerA-like domain-containing protein n=1 Tax=Capnocytophaga gingivalis TaxID=1017 RepID=UPI002B49EDC8|nr:helicase HerA-like domain-containing protein [Capnocytophaga gingivalis]MEB3013522.1 helicase HerA-like domain-containing protein [Capnocytophaga gingivalis]